MSKGMGLNDVDMQKFYIVTQPTRLSDLQLDDLESDPNAYAIRKGRKLRERRMAKMRDQLDY
jgi:hypothetical protein